MTIINVDDKQLEPKIMEGVRQGCVLSPRNVCLYLEEAIKFFKHILDTGIEIQELKIAVLRFTDDIALQWGDENKETESLPNVMLQKNVKE